MAGDAHAQMKNVGKRVGRFPGLRQIAVQNHLVIALQEAVEEQAVEVLRLAVGGKARIEIRGVRLDQQSYGRKILVRGTRASDQQKRGDEVTKQRERDRQGLTRIATIAAGHNRFYP